jgi:hypothetical protein
MLRALLAVLVSLLFGGSAYAQTSPSPCTTFGPGSPSCPYQWVGVTSVAFLGDGNGLGLVGMTTQCRADFGPGARMCQSSEIVASDTLNPNAIPAQGCWVRPSWRWSAGNGDAVFEDTGTAQSAYNLSCSGWRIASTASFGLTLLPSGTFAPPQTVPDPPERCSVSKPAACCKPIAVGETQASLMLPTGVGALAMLSLLRGGA